VTTGTWTPLEPAQAELIVKKSRFLAWVFPLASAEEAYRKLEAAQDPAARHHPYAWKFEPRYHFSDDGEPGGTAGSPILAALNQQKADRVLVVVPRHFGGIKLGAGGLARAYAQAARLGLEACVRVAIEEKLLCSLELPVQHLGACQALLAKLGADLTPELSGQTARFELELSPEECPELAEQLAKITRGEARLSCPSRMSG
jgi:putative IMPACT (imprinted ancient) family translation regulator